MKSALISLAPLLAAWAAIIIRYSIRYHRWTQTRRFFR